MIYALWFLIKLFSLIAAVIWVAGQSGAAEFTWFFRGDEYQLELTLGVFGVAGLIFLVLILVLYKLLLSIGFSFKTQRLKRVSKKLRNSQISVLKSFSALSSGDERKAVKYASHARRINEDHSGMLDYLDGVIAKSQGDVSKATGHFKQLAIHKHARPLALNNLTSLQIGAGQLVRATKVAEYAYNLNPKQRWIVKTLYRLYIRQGRFDDAEIMRHVCLRLKLISKEQAKDIQAKLLHAKSITAREDGRLEEAFSDLKQAYKIDKKSLPVALDLLSIYMKRNEKKKAQKIIEAMWLLYQHPEFIDAWRDLMPVLYKDKPAKYVAWWETFLSFKPDSVMAHVMLAKVMLQQDLYGQARSYLEMALRLGEGKDLYLTFAELEKEQYNDLDASQIWTRKALGCSASSCWVCKITGTHYQNWSLFVGHEMNFYSLKWCDDKNGFNDAPDISLHENADLNHFEMADAINPVFETPKTLKAL